jgi:hypothetical protein
MQPLVDEFVIEIRKMSTGGPMRNNQDKNELDNTSMDKEDQNNQFPRSGGGFFEIHVKGHLNSQWSDWLEGLEVKLLENGEMILFGPLVDQAALMGVLNKLSRLNLTLLSVNKMKGQIDRRQNE